MLLIFREVLIVWLIAVFSFNQGTADNSQNKGNPGDPGVRIPVNKTNIFLSTQGIRFSRNLPDGNKTQEINVSTESVTEVDTRGNSVNVDGKHGISDFQSNARPSGSPNQTNVSFPYSDGVQANCLIQSYSVPNNSASIIAEVCVITKNGTLILGDENTTVVEGQLKFNIIVSNWTWNASAGAFLDLKFNIKLPPGRNAKEDSAMMNGSRHPKKFNLGGGALAYFSTKVKLDNGWQNMSSDYPKLEVNGANNYITIRIPRFNSSALYDPVLDAGNTTDSGTNSTSQSSSSIPTTTSSVARSGSPATCDVIQLMLLLLASLLLMFS